jgi:dephospho-CoA kinase
MNTAQDIKKALTALIGNDAYIDSRLNKAVVANFLLSSEDNKQAINAIVHPAVIKDFYSTGLAWMECAILYEAHLEDFVDKVVAVTAPREVRIERVMQRDGISYERASEWVDKQMLQENVESRADYVIVNDGRQSLDSQVAAVLKQIEKDNIN